VVDEFAILEPEAARALLEACRGTPADRSDAVLLHEMFDREVARSPDAIAVAFHGQEWTYRELDRRARQLAERLARCGGRQNAAFGIYLPRGLDVPVAVLGILKAGGAYVALDPSYPAERLRQMISASGMRYLITRRGFGDANIAATAELVELDP
jgi:non-ribosomal peptide synthetase component F